VDYLTLMGNNLFLHRKSARKSPLLIFAEWVAQSFSCMSIDQSAKKKKVRTFAYRDFIVFSKRRKLSRSSLEDRAMFLALSFRHAVTQ
jgi:hypothetical protein